MTNAIRDFEIAIDQSELDDLQARLAMTRFPDAETGEGWDQGIPLNYVRELVEYWQNSYDWRRCEAALNHYPHHLVEIDNVDIHFMHIRSPREDAKPVIMTHGWPGSILEFMDVIEPLTNPAANEPAFHLVIPSLPGYGFSGKPTETGWTVQKIAETWAKLMAALGYSEWFAQGGDWGAMVTTMIGAQAGSENSSGCKGIHINMPVATPPAAVMENPTEEELAGLARIGQYRDTGSGYSTQQKTKPQTLGYGLADSPVGQMAWIVEKFQEWSDCAEGKEHGHPEPEFSRDHLLDNVMIYWLNNAAASSARLYWHSFAQPGDDPVEIPSGISVFPHEIMRPSRRWAEARYKNIAYWNRPDRGGHFAAMERPEAFVSEIRACFGEMAL